jgi:hypothetical protein
MMNELIKQRPQAIKFTQVNPTLASNYATSYANNVEVATTYFDVNMIFGEVMGVTGETLNVERRVRVVMPLGQVKLLALTLTRQLQTYEENFGKISLDPKVVPDELRTLANEWEKTSGE